MEATQATTVAGTTENSEDEQVSKYMLLDRLFKFLEAEEDDEPVNPVLAGYFSKVVQLLVNRKQKQIVPYIIADENKVIEKLLRHVYSRSVAEVIHRLLHIVESNFEDDLSVKIAAALSEETVGEHPVSTIEQPLCFGSLWIRTDAGSTFSTRNPVSSGSSSGMGSFPSILFTCISFIQVLLLVF